MRLVSSSAHVRIPNTTADARRQGFPAVSRLSGSEASCLATRKSGGATTGQPQDTLRHVSVCKVQGNTKSVKPATGQSGRLGERLPNLLENGSLPRLPLVARLRTVRSLPCSPRSCRLDRLAPLRMLRIILSGFCHGATGTRAASVKKLTIATDEGRTTLSPGDPGSGTFVKIDEGRPVLRGARRHASPLERVALRQRPAARRSTPRRHSGCSASY